MDVARVQESTSVTLEERVSLMDVARGSGCVLAFSLQWRSRVTFRHASCL